MESGTLQASLRVLYTINNNPQYILAKSSSQVQTIVCSDTATCSEPAYAKAPLRACVAAVCDSSPELLQDPTRDFSLYVLDPLEAQPLPTNLAHTPHHTSSPRGVAVALGLMSWVLESNDSTNVFVTGTIVPNSPPALEVVFALREIKRMPKHTLHSNPSFSSISASGASQLITHHLQQEQQTLTRSADFPELYIGPPRRAPGRPEGSTSSKVKVKPQTSTFSLSARASSSKVDTRCESMQEVVRKPKQRTKPRPPRAPPSCSPFICEPLTRHPTTGSKAGATRAATFYQQSYPSSQNQSQPRAYLDPQMQPYLSPTDNPLPGLLSAVPSTSSNTPASTTIEKQGALLSAIQGLLAANPHLLQLAVANMGISAGNGQQTAENKPVAGGNQADDVQDDADSDIVILDSSTINTTAFRKPSRRQVVANNDTSPLVTSQECPIPDIDSSPLPASTPPSEQGGTPTSSQTSTPTVIPQAETSAAKHGSPGWTHATPSVPGMPLTPTPSRTRKRKLDEYIWAETYSSTPISPPSPSPSTVRTSGSVKALTTSSSTGETKSVTSPPVQLPSMSGSMRSIATANSPNSSTHGNPSYPSIENGIQPNRLSRDGQEQQVGYSRNTDVPSNVVSDATSLKRRRTLNLNEVMEELEARKNAKVGKRPSLGRKLEVSSNAVRAAFPSRSATIATTSRHPQSSPPRPLFRTDSLAVSSLPPSTCQSGSVIGATIFNPLTTAPTCTAPSAFTSTATPPRNPLKNFVLPAWARTCTAMLPRLSEEAQARQRAEQEAKKAQVSLRRREAAKAKRKRHRDPQRLSKESSDEDDITMNDPKPRALHLSSSAVRGAPLPPPPPPSLPVFASAAVEPIQSSPPQSQRQVMDPVIPTTPPRTPVSPVSMLQSTPSKSESSSLFTPSGQDHGSLFTPSTPSVTRSLIRDTFVPRSPTVLHRSSVNKSPRKNASQIPRTPKRSGTNHHTPRGGRNAPPRSPSLAMRTPQTQTGMGTRTFLLPPPSPSILRMPQVQNRVRSMMSGGLTPKTPKDFGIMKQGPLLNTQNIEQDEDSKGREGLGCKTDNALLGHDMSVPQTPTRLTTGDQETRDLQDFTSHTDVPHVEAGYASSPLPPSSPLPVSPFSSPRKHDSDLGVPTGDNLIMPDSDILLPSTSDSDEPQRILDTMWPSEDTCATSWFTGSETSAWLTETEAWLTDTEGGPLLTDSDGAWLSDSDAVFGDMSSLPPSSASNWLSNDADLDTDGEGVAMEGRNIDTAAFEKAFAAFVERNGHTITKDHSGGGSASHGTGLTESEFWESMRPLLGGSALADASTATGNVPGDPADRDKVVQDIQQLLDDLVGA